MRQMIESSEVLENLQNSFISCKEASEYMLRENNINFLKGLLKRFDDGVSVIDETEKETLKNFIQIAYYIYTYSSEDTGLEDYEYDKLYDLLVQNGEEDFVSLPEIQNGEEEHHAYTSLRGTLSKIHYLSKPQSGEKVNKSRKSLDEWIKHTEEYYYEKTGDRIDLKDQDIYVFPKWDGVSAIFQFNEDGSIDKVLTRGYTKFNTAKNVSQHFAGIKRPINPPRKYGLKTEILVSEEGFNNYNLVYGTDYKQSRSIASGIINSNDSDERDKYLTVMQLRYMDATDEIEKLCPEVFDHPHIRCKLGEYDKIENFAKDHHYTDDLRCDGAVIYIINPEIQKVLGRKNDKNKFEVAYKFTEEHDYSEVVDIKFQTGLFGRITPVVKFKPVKIKGNTIDSATMGSIDRFEKMKLAKGDKIKVLYDIIPYVTLDRTCTRSGNKPIKPPKVCPSCGEPLTRNGDILSCTNSNCDWRKKGKILNYFVKMNIQNISYATVDLLYDKGYLKSIKDIYKLEKHKEEIVNLPKFGYDKFANIIEEIDKKRKVSDSLLMGSIGIEGIAVETFDKVFSKYSLKDLLEFADEDNYQEIADNVNGIGNKKAEAIIRGIQRNEKLIDFLLGEIEVYHDNSQAAFKVCFTKVRDKNLESEIEKAGGKVVNSVTADTTYLVVPDLDVVSSKTKSANKNNVKIIPIDEFYKVLDQYK